MKHLIIVHLDGIIRQDNVPVLFILNVSWHGRDMPNCHKKRKYLLKFVVNITPNTNTGEKYTGRLWRELDLILPPSATTSALQGRQLVTTSRTMSPSTTLVNTLFSHQIVFTKDTTIVTLTLCTSQLNYLQGQPLALLVIN